MSLNLYLQEENSNREESINRYKNMFLNFAKKPPTLEDALTQMFKSSNVPQYKLAEMVTDILAKCNLTIDPIFEQIQMKYNNITKQDAYIICSYTCESIDRDYSPYRILNQNLVSNNRQNGVNNVSKYLYIFLKSLRKLPRYYPENKILYRCLTCHVDLSDTNDKNKIAYKVGNKKTFWGFTSTSTDANTTYNFLKTKEEMKTGTIFSLTGDVWGYNIQMFNFYHENEILLEPERKFKIINVMPPINQIINITCEILQTNLILSDTKQEPEIYSYDFKDDDNIKTKSNRNIDKYITRYEMEVSINEETKYNSGFGILCDIPSKNIKALITYNHMMNLDCLNNGEKMTLYIDNKEHEINIKLNRYKYTNEDLDITIIEILDTDNIRNLIGIDKFINSRNYTGTNITSVSLSDNGDFEYSNHKISEKNNDYYICNIDSIKEGIIILKDNLKLLGIIKHNEKEMNIIPMNVIISKINFIKCIYYIKKEDVDKDIQIINNKDSDDNIQNEEIEKEIKVIIDGEIKSNILTYKFNKEGAYTIYLISYNDLTNMSYMFNRCSLLKELDLSSFNTNQVTNMAFMLSNCFSLIKLNLGTFNTSQVTNMKYMFNNCSSLKELDLSPFNTNNVADMSGMFFNCFLINELKLSSFNTSQVNNMSYMFSYCSSLKELNLQSFDTKKVTDMKSMFKNCTNLTQLNLSSFNTDKVTNMSEMFFNCSSLNQLNISTFNTNQVTDMSYMFNNCHSLNELDVSKFNTEKVTNMKSIFNSCSSLKELKLSSFKTNNVTNMSDMFNNCCLIKELDLLTFNTEQVTDMSDMFFNCRSLQVLIVSSFNTSNVTDMSYMFNNCYSLNALNLSSFNTKNVIDMSEMFNNCSSIKELNLSSFNTNQVINMPYMFSYCTSLKKLTLTSFTINQVADMSHMFDSISKACKIKCKDNNTLKQFKNSTGCIII